MPIAIYSYLFALNLIVYALFAIDKRKAVYGEHRMPEALLLVLSAIGGAYGAGMGMILYNHKVRKPMFLILVPVFFVLWALLLIFLCCVR